MNDIKKKIAALTVASTMLTSLTSCQNIIKYTEDLETGTSELTGYASIDEVKNNYYIVEIENYYTHETTLHLTKRVPQSGGYYYYKLGTRITVCNESKSNEKYSCYGKVNRITSFTEFLLINQRDIKKNYTAKEIEEIFEEIKKNYSSYSFDDTNKTLIKK